MSREPCALREIRVTAPCNVKVAHEPCAPSGVMGTAESNVPGSYELCAWEAEQALWWCVAPSPEGLRLRHNTLIFGLLMALCRSSPFTPVSARDIQQGRNYRPAAKEDVTS
ncbi:hypothetical protein NDU88_001263 [Pleurodeles waltl]|uniref:Uncharacterized protein n=1 Tax=Pleurodeles waltl TaxID=8319 RepID=A0AAV7S9F0_PLEWA|nr:hypothetical protein NDU88_001263 [Pleurodeles waltl]